MFTNDSEWSGSRSIVHPNPEQKSKNKYTQR